MWDFYKLFFITHWNNLNQQERKWKAITKYGRGRVNRLTFMHAFVKTIVPVTIKPYEFCLGLTPNIILASRDFHPLLFGIRTATKLFRSSFNTKYWESSDYHHIYPYPIPTTQDINGLYRTKPVSFLHLSPTFGRASCSGCRLPNVVKIIGGLYRRSVYQALDIICMCVCMFILAKPSIYRCTWY